MSGEADTSASLESIKESDISSVYDDENKVESNGKELETGDNEEETKTPTVREDESSEKTENDAVAATEESVKESSKFAETALDKAGIYTCNLLSSFNYFGNVYLQ